MWLEKNAAHLCITDAAETVTIMKRVKIAKITVRLVYYRVEMTQKCVHWVEDRLSNRTIKRRSIVQNRRRVPKDMCVTLDQIRPFVALC